MTSTITQRFGRRRATAGVATLALWLAADATADVGAAVVASPPPPTSVVSRTDVPVATPRATQSTPADGLTLIAAWVAAVEAHVPGELDPGLLGVAALSSEELRRVWGDVQVLVDLVLHPTHTKFTLRPLDYDGALQSGFVPDRTFSAEERIQMDALAARLRTLGMNAVLRRSAMLHTDVIVLAPQVAATSAGATSMRAPVWMFIGDGGSLGIESVTLHWQIARRSVAAMTPDPRLEPFARDWYRATLALEQGGELFDGNHLSMALRLFPDDPQILLFAGCQHEAFAAPLFQAFAGTRRAPGQNAGIRSPAAELAEAERYFRRALAGDATLVEARIRLGRVLGQRGQAADAVRELTRAFDAPLEPVLEYYAQLFVGAEHHAARRWAEARAAFARAAALMPRARVAQLALAQVAREQGEPAVVTASLARALVDLPDDQLSDPWWAYRRAQGRHAEALLGRVRRTATRGTP